VRYGDNQQFVIENFVDHGIREPVEKLAPNLTFRFDARGARKSQRVLLDF